MNKRTVNVSHVVYLSIDEEQRFVNAVLKWVGKVHGVVGDALHEAVIDWIKAVDEGKRFE
jgi:hypothetical protein